MWRRVTPGFRTPHLEAFSDTVSKNLNLLHAGDAELGHGGPGGDRRLLVQLPEAAPAQRLWVSSFEHCAWWWFYVEGSAASDPTFPPRLPCCCLGSLRKMYVGPVPVSVSCATADGRSTWSAGLCRGPVLLALSLFFGFTRSDRSLAAGQRMGSDQSCRLAVSAARPLSY